MKPTKLELALGALVMYALQENETNAAGRVARAIPVRWYNGEPYVRDVEPCGHDGDLTTTWQRRKDWRLPEVITTCDKCGGVVLPKKGD